MFKRLSKFLFISSFESIFLVCERFLMFKYEPQQSTDYTIYKRADLSS